MNTVIENLKKRLEKEEKIIIKIKVVAGAKTNSVEEFSEDIVKIKINKPAVDGKANKAIIEYLSDIFDLPKSNIIILRGEKNSIKDLQIVKKRAII